MQLNLHARCLNRLLVRAAACGCLLLGARPGVAVADADGPEIPDVGPPFDVKAFEAYSLPAGMNADSLYLLAQRSLIRHEATETTAYALKPANQENARKAALDGWSEANEDIRKWLDANAKALVVWRSGTTRAAAIEIPLKEFCSDSLLPIAQDTRDFTVLALLKASQLTSEGHTAEAWSWYRSALRASRHIGMNGCAIERMVGTDAYRRARDPILNWAARREVSAADLRRALGDVIAVDAMTAPVSRTLKVEYLSVQHSIPLVLAKLRKDHPIMAVAIRQEGRPQKMVRVANLWFSNWLANAERPRWRRKPMSDERIGLFEPDPGSPKLPPARDLKKMVAMQLTGLANMGMMRTSPDEDYALPGMMSLFDTDDRDRVNRIAVCVGLALQLYFREHGRFPAALAELVNGRYLKTIPPDPFGKGEAIHYRLVGDAADRVVLWSVGFDGNNQAGELPTAKTDSRVSPNTVFELKAQRMSQDRK
jgi:hypothetical protein